MITHPTALERRVLAGPGEEVSNPAARPEGGDVVGGPVGVLALHAVAGDRRVDQPGMASGQGLGIEAETLKAAEANVGDEDVSARNQVVGDLFALRGGEVETMLRLDRLSISKMGLVGIIWPVSEYWNVREGSPAGGSIFTTSAPQSARIPPAAGPQPTRRVRRPSRLRVVLPCLPPRGPNRIVERDTRRGGTLDCPVGAADTNATFERSARSRKKRNC